MKLLAIDGASRAASAALMVDGVLVAESFVENELTHSQMLLPMVDETLSRAGVPIGELDAIAVVTGPGSFTGVRIGVSTAKGLAHALGIPVVGVEALTALCYNVPSFSGVLAPMMDARRDQVYAAAFCYQAGQLVNILPGEALRLSDFLDQLGKTQGNILFLGDGTPPHKEEILSTLGERASIAPAHWMAIRASSVAMAAQAAVSAGKGVSAHEIMPLYYRAPQAERMAASGVDGK